MATDKPQGLLPETNLLAFQAIGLEVTQRLGHLVHASLAGSSLSLPYYIWIGDRRSSAPSSPWNEIVKCWGGLNEEAVHEFTQEWPRAIVVAGMAILESFFKGMMQFGRKVVHGPTRSSRPSPTPRGKVRSEGVYGPRLDKLRALYGLPLSSAEALLLEIERVASLRNEIAHDASLYELRESSSGVFYADAKPLPEATTDEALEVLMLVTEFTDSIFVEVFEHLFGRMPDVRPLTPAINEAHKQQRQAWRAAAEAPPKIEWVEEPKWAYREYPGGGGHTVTIQGWRVSATPTGIPGLPALFWVMEHKAHGKTARWQVDGGEWLEPVGTTTVVLLKALLQGQEVVVQYFPRAGEKPCHLGISLEGFSEAWEQGWAERSGKVQALGMEVEPTQQSAPASDTPE
jgi:hypothetical protein